MREPSFGERGATGAKEAKGAKGAYERMQEKEKEADAGAGGKSSVEEDNFFNDLMKELNNDLDM